MSEIILKENTSAPATPATGKVTLYAKGDGQLYMKDDAGMEKLVRIGSNGWTPTGIQPIYISATAIRFSSIDLTSVFPAGTKIKLTQTTIKYFYVIASAYSGGNTDLTLTAGIDFTVVNAAITEFNYSHGLAFGFQEYFSWSPTINADNYTINSVSITAWFAINGKTLIFDFYAGIDFSGGNSYYFFVPYPFVIIPFSYRTFAGLENNSSGVSPATILAHYTDKFSVARKDRAYWVPSTALRISANAAIRYTY